MRLLIVEDDATIADFVAKGLTEAGFAVDVAADGARGLELAVGGPYDVAIVDVMLPQLDGLTLIDRMRARGVRTPVLILSARRTVDDRVRGLQAGGDDYLTKPFAFAELLARVQALIRRSTGYDRTDATHRRGPHARPADPARRARRPGARPAPARVRAARVPDAQPRPGPLEDDDPLARLGLQLQPGTNVVDVLVSRLREKIDKDFDPKLLHTVRGVGYVLEPRGLAKLDLEQEFRRPGSRSAKTQFLRSPGLLLS